MKEGLSHWRKCYIAEASAEMFAFGGFFCLCELLLFYKVRLAYEATPTFSLWTAWLQFSYLLDSLPPFGHCFFLLQGLVWIFLQSLLQHLRILVNLHLFSQVPKGLKLSMRWQCAVSSPQGAQHLLQVHTDMPAMDWHKFNNLIMYVHAHACSDALM